MGGRDKLLLDYNGRTLLQRAVELLAHLQCCDKILVTTKARLEHVALPHNIRIVINSSPEEGQSGSLRLGIEAACGEWFLFLTADQPLLTPACLQPLFELAENNPDKIIFPSLNGKPCSPTLFPARFREDLLSITGDIGGRVIREAHPAACLTFEAENPGDFLDIDNEDDYLSLLKGMAQDYGKVNRKRV